MRVVITGATGNVGTGLVRALGEEDQISEIVGVARRRPDWSPPKTRWATADLAVDDLDPIVEGADAVVNLAWSFHPIRRPHLTWKNNVLGAIRLFQAATSAGVGALVHASSVGAYAPATDERPVDESWPTHALPTSGYGREKSYLERVLDTVERDHPDVRVVRMRPGFIFTRSAAESQRRYFAGPFLPNALVRPELIPVVPDLPGLRFQTLHTRDAADAYRRVLLQDVRGAFNIAADPIVDAAALADLLGARVIPMPAWPLRAGVAAAHLLRLLPASPALLDLFLSVPVMDTTRARTELGWTPTTGALDAIAEVMAGMRDASGGPTPPLDEHAGGTGRSKEIATGVGYAAGVTSDGR